MILTTTIRTQFPAGTVLHVTGEVDTFAAEGLRAALLRLAARPSGVVVVDLSGVTFMSCTPLAVLAQVKAQLGSRLLLGRTSRIVARLLDVTGSTAFLPPLAEDGEDAVAPDGQDGSGPGGAPGGRAIEGASCSCSRTDVHRACGLLMAIHACNAEQAWSMLALAAARSGVPVGDLVQLLLRAREAPHRASP
ncbi:MAG: anti-sigma factor antagonist, partial [Actinomycetes bacterium]